MLRLASTAILVVALCAMPIGCGSGDQGKSEPNKDAYHEVLIGLRKAALSNQHYPTIRATEDPGPKDWGVEILLKPNEYLKPGERGSIISLCETAWQLAVNRETELLKEKKFIYFRIKSRAGVVLGRTTAGQKAVQSAMPELNRTMDLASYDRELNGRYKRACDL